MLVRLRLALGTATALAAAFFVTTAMGQVLPRNKAPAKQAGTAPAVAPVAPQPVVPAPGETAGQTRREGRQEARDARADARNLGETGSQARETARETRQETRQNIQATRGADLGVWFNTQANNGLIVADLTPNSMFASAGLQEGDRVVSVNGQLITSEAQFIQFLTSPSIGAQPIQIVVVRNGQQQTIVLQSTAVTQGIVNYDPLYQYGLVLDNRNPNQILVQQVYPRTPAYYAGIRQGDVITSFGGRNITTVDAFSQGLLQANGNIPLQITRSGQSRNLQLEALSAGDSSVRTALRPNFDGAASGNANVGGANVGVQGGANINAQGGANINAQGGVRATTPATQPANPKAVPPANRGTGPAVTPPASGSANVSGAAGASGTAGAGTPAAAASGAAGAPGTSGTPGGTGTVPPQTGTVPPQ